MFVWTKVEQAANHNFSFHPVENNLIKISSRDNSRWLTTNGKKGSTITQTTNKDEASYWKIVHLDQDKIAIHYVDQKMNVSNTAEPVLEDSNLSLNICGGSAKDGTKVILYPSYYDSYTNQQFVLHEHT